MLRQPFGTYWLSFKEPHNFLNMDCKITRIKLLYILLFGLSWPFSLCAKHIVGGDMRYECLGNDNYRIIMRVYRDCKSENDDSLLDDPAYISIHRSNGTEYLTEAVPLVPLGYVPPNVNEDCVQIPSELCVEAGQYILEVYLPTTPGGYSVAYQRCCRNATIANIENPSITGATYTIQISGTALSTCNDSPVFNAFPSTVICAGYDFYFDHSATDAEGDSLAYEFCSPLDYVNDNNTPRPEQASAPPYPSVVFKSPPYFSSFPMGNGILQIDPRTGIITGLPNTLGQFVVGVCVKEYRNGLQIGSIQRDFQFNVTNCEPNVNVGLADDGTTMEGALLVRACGNKTVDIKNTSTKEEFIQSYLWEFYINGVKRTFDTKDVTVTFPANGTYNGRLVLNPHRTCRDSADIVVVVADAVSADYTYDANNCQAGPIDFKYEGSGPVGEYAWDFGDGAASNQASPTHEYISAGSYGAKLVVRSAEGCTDSLETEINYFPIPPLQLAEPDIVEGCEPVTANFDKLSGVLDATYQIVWDFGDGNSSSEIAPIHTYSEGNFDIALSITTQGGCTFKEVYPNWVNVAATPTADFGWSPKNLDALHKNVTFENKSSGASAWNWDFGDGLQSNLPNPEHEYRDTGTYIVRLVAVGQSGCRDTLLHTLDVLPFVHYVLPNAFSPNHDDINDVFMGKGSIGRAADFQMTIWDRWGRSVFATTNPSNAWNGQMNNTGRELPGGVYVCLVSFTGAKGEKVELKQFVTLVK